MGNVLRSCPPFIPTSESTRCPQSTIRREFAAATLTRAAETVIAHGALALAGTVVDAASARAIVTDSRYDSDPRAAVRICTEHDLLGDRDVPADVYYGVHTARALENFPISGVPIFAVAATSSWSAAWPR